MGGDINDTAMDQASQATYKSSGTEAIKEHIQKSEYMLLS